MSADAEKERQRLAALYASMPSAQLRQIASESSELTDAARAALDFEIGRRGLSIEDSPARETPQVAPDNSPDLKLVMVRRFRDLPEALLAKGSLDSAAIEAFLADDNMVRLDWFISNLIGGVKLLVRPEDVEEATAVLDQPIPENFEVDGVGEYQQPRCPQCNDLDISFEEFNTGWACHHCGHTWDAPADEPAAP